MRLTGPILATAGIATLTASLVIAHAASAPKPLVTHTVATTSSAPASTVTVVGTGSVEGTPDTATMSFGVEVTAPSAAGAYSSEAAQAQRLINTLRGAGVKESDIRTQWVSLYPNQPSGGFTASSSVSAVIHGIAHAGSVIDAAVRATGNSIRMEGVSLSIADTSSLMASARASAVHDALTKAQQYAQAAGMKVGPVLSISETGSMPSPIRYASAAAGVAGPQPIEAGQQTLELSVTVVYALTQ